MCPAVCCILMCVYHVMCVVVGLVCVACCMMNIACCSCDDVHGMRCFALYMVCGVPRVIVRMCCV